MSSNHPPYLDPYLRAARQHGAGFQSLLWASPQTQEARFAALVRLCDFAGRRVLDAGCGRADLYDYLLQNRMRPAHYVGLEAVPDLAAAARAKPHRDYQIVNADFVREPHRLLAGADLVVFCGSLNTLDTDRFYATLRAALSATGRTLLFNFLSSPHLAGAPWLTWHRPEAVLAYVTQFGDAAILDDYTPGDCTIRVETAGGQASGPAAGSPRPHSPG